MSLYTVCTSWTLVHTCMHTEPSAVNPLCLIYLSIFLFYSIFISSQYIPPLLLFIVSAPVVPCAAYLIL